MVRSNKLFNNKYGRPRRCFIMSKRNKKSVQRCERYRRAFTCIQELLPIRGDLYEVLSIEGDTNKFKARIDCNILDVEGVANFVESYTKRTNETLRKLSPTYPSEKNEYSVCLYYRCQHKTGHQPSMNPKKFYAKSLQND